jgi:ligand-binding sensor domain-containing protein/signal transduction histidine kinase
MFAQKGMPSLRPRSSCESARGLFPRAPLPRAVPDHARSKSDFEPAAASPWQRGIWLGIWLAAVTPLAAMEADRAGDSHSIQGWFTEHGLPSYKVRAVTQTRDGYLWIATAQGLARFDGSRFTVFTGASNPELRGGGFFAVQETPDGTLWFGGDNGLFRWDHGHFDRFTTEQGLPHNYVRGLTLTRDGALVVCTRTGYSFVRDGRIQTPGGIWKQISGVTRSFLERADGSKLLGTSVGLWRISGESIERLSGTTNLPGDGFASLIETRDGSLWIGYSRGIRRMLPDGRSEDYGESQGLADPRVATLYVDRAENLWIGTYGGEFYRLAGGRIEPVGCAEQIGVTAIRQFHEDREGGLWVAGASGLFRLKNNVSRTIGRTEGLTRTSVYAVLEDAAGSWWIGLWGGGVYRCDQRQAAPLEAPESAGLDEILSLAEGPPGTLWIGAISGLYRQTGGTITNLYRRAAAAAWRKQLTEKPDTLLPGLAHSRVNSIATDEAEGLWIATDGALYHGREGAFRAYTAADGLPGSVFTSVMRARNGDIWVAAPPGGAACLHDGRWTSYLCGRELSDVAPRAVYEDTQGTIWVTTEGGGLNRFKNGGWRTFTARHGLADDFIAGLVDDGAGNLWIACPRGIMRIPREQFDELDRGRRPALQPRIINRFDGLPPAECNHQGSPAAWRTRDGRLLFATDRGVAVIQPASLVTNRLVPPMHIESLQVNGAEADTSRPVVVPPGNNDVQIHYTALSLLAPEKVRFKIRLAPLDSDWVDIGGQREIRYAKLPPGDYSFRAIACNNEGVWNTEGVGVAFRVRPYFYQTAWFAGLVILIVGGGASGFYTARIRQARRQMAVLEKLVNERTGELRSAKDAAEAAVVARNETIDALKRAEAEREKLHRQLLDISHRAGMAEVAAGVLHNVGNVLNSVNVSASVLSERIRHSRIGYVGRAAALMREHAATLGEFITRDPKGSQLPAFLTDLAAQLENEQSVALDELSGLHRNIEHINEIVAMQQAHARVAGVTEKIQATELVEEALRMNERALAEEQVELVRQYDPDLPQIEVDRHKVVQILTDLIRNAEEACGQAGAGNKRVTLCVANGADRIKVSVSDNGEGIPAENLTRIFNHGFTTRPGGHGFSLHSGALAAKELGGCLIAHSDGPGHGAIFTLELPLHAATKPEV